MKNRVSIMSRKSAEEMIVSGFPKNTAVVSFCDPPSKHKPLDNRRVDYTGVCNRFLTVAVHDIDIEILCDFGLTFET